MQRIVRKYSSLPPDASVGFIGLGLMGNAMAHNLLTKSKITNFYVFDTSKETMAKFIKDHPGAKACTSPKEVATKAKSIISMVPAGAHVKQVFLGEQVFTCNIIYRALFMVCNPDLF